MSLSKVSVIIINYNGKELLEKCLDSLFKTEYDNYEVILVDNNSTDDTIEFITNNYPSVIIMNLDSNKGFAEPNNVGAKIAKGEFLLFLNNDTIVTPNFLTELVIQITKNPKTAICQSLLLKLDNTIDSSGDFMDKLGVVYNSKTIITNVRKIFSPRAACMLIKKDVFDKLNGFDKKFIFSFEDVDLGWRSWILGYESLIVPKSIVYHIGGITTEKFADKSTFHGAKNQLSMKITNYEFPLNLKNLLLFFIIYGSRELKIWFDYKIKGKTMITSTKFEETIAQKPNFRIVVKSIFWIFSNVSYLISKHKRVNSNRILNTKDLEKLDIISNFKQ